MTFPKLITVYEREARTVKYNPRLLWGLPNARGFAIDVFWPFWYDNKKRFSGDWGARNRGYEAGGYGELGGTESWGYEAGGTESRGHENRATCVAKDQVPV